MSLELLIQPEVVLVGGCGPHTARHTVAGRPSSYHDFAFGLDHYLTKDDTGSSISGQEGSSSLLSQSRRNSALSIDLDRDSSPVDHYTATYNALKAERTKAKHELKLKKAALRALSKSNKRPSESTPAVEETPSMSFADMLNQSPPRASPPVAQTKAQLQEERMRLKAHAKELKEQERMHRVKEAVERRNAKIDAHDLAVREKAAQKAALKQARAKAETVAWNAQTRTDNEKIWAGGSNQRMESLLAKTHALSV